MAKKNENWREKSHEARLDLAIDENELDREWVEQPRLYFRYAAELADVKRDVDEAKTEVEVSRAEVGRMVRLNPPAFSLNKLTEKGLEEVVATHETVTDAQDKLREARHRADILQAAVTALDHRRRALESLVSLFLSSYYAAPKAPKGSEDRMDDVKKRAARSKGVKRREK